jgi:hypothetical protein
MKRFLSLALSLLLCSAYLHAETLFYKKDGAELTPDEHAIVYTIMLKNQFPSSIALGAYVDDELGAMRKEIENTLPKSNIQPAFIPTTLYQFLVLHFINKHFLTITEAAPNVFEKKLLENKDHAFLRITSTYKLEPKNFEAIVKEQAFINFHRTINNFIITTFKEKGISLEPKSVQDFLSLLDIDTFWKQGDNPIKWTLFDSTIKDFNKNLLKRAIEIDHQAYVKKEFPLYRGAPNDDQDIASKQKLSNTYQSISFGSSLLGGFIQDQHASAFFYATQPNSSGFAVIINKKDYTPDKLGAMFFIPPLIGLIDLLGQGEFFHSRSKVPRLAKTDRQSFGLPDKLLNLKPLYEIKGTTQKNAQEIYDEIPIFIKNHSEILINTSLATELPEKAMKSLPSKHVKN